MKAFPLPFFWGGSVLNLWILFLKTQLAGVSTAHWPSCSYQPNDNSQILATWPRQIFGPRGSLSDLNWVSLRDISIFCHSSIIHSAGSFTLWFHLPKARLGVGVDPLGCFPQVICRHNHLRLRHQKSHGDPGEGWIASLVPILVSVANTHTQKFVWWISVSVAHVLFFWKLEQEMMGDRWDPDPTMDGDYLFELWEKDLSVGRCWGCFFQSVCLDRFFFSTSFLWNE